MRIALSDLAEGRSYRYVASFGEEDVEGLLETSLAEPLSITVECTTVEGVTYVRVEAKGKVYAVCDLCGTECVADAKCTIDDELTTESDCYDETDDCYDLDKLIDEAIVMCAPRKVLCKLDCKGLCPTCGKNLNEGACTCQEQKPAVGDNNPFAALQDILTGGANNGSTKM